MYSSIFLLSLLTGLDVADARPRRQVHARDWSSPSPYWPSSRSSIVPSGVSSSPGSYPTSPYSRSTPAGTSPVTSPYPTTWPVPESSPPSWPSPPPSYPSPPPGYPSPPPGWPSPSPGWPSPYPGSPSPQPTWPSPPPYPTTPAPYPSSSVVPPGQCDYWLADIKHQGIAAFNPDPETYQVFRNVQDFGAKGDGVTDDAAAINKAISSGGRCGPGSCNASTTTPAVVYFPPGTYLISSSIIDYYYTQLIGNPNCLPVIRASRNFSVSADPYLIDGDPYNKAGVLEFGATNIFWRQIRNFVLDMTLVPAAKAVSGIHWPTGQATSITNVVFQMSQANGTQQQGVVIDSGSGGFLNDLIFNGGKYGGNFGNQQFTMRNLTFNNVNTAIYQSYSWGWVYAGITINNCAVGLNMYNGGPKAGAVGSITFFDSEINNTPVGFYTARTNNSLPASGSSLILENVRLNNVPVAVRGGNNQTALAGTTGSTLITGWGQGHEYTPNGPKIFQGPITPVQRSGVLVEADGSYYTQSKPQYQQYSVSDFISARDEGATGNGHTDDTAALQKAILLAAQSQKILFVDQGDYLVSSTIYIPPGARIVGETYSVIFSTGAYFDNIDDPKPVVQIGQAGQQGSIEWSDMIVSTRGQQRGAILFEYNLVSPSSAPSGLWDVHARVGGFTGSELEVAQCPTTPNTHVTTSNLVQHCIAGFLTMHITPGSAGLYMENNWLWTADHDVDSPDQTQITIYNGRGLLVESQDGPLWFWGSAVEHHTLYQYTFVNTNNVYAGFIQTETPYYQPNPSAPVPFPYEAAYSDPTFPTPVVHAGNLTIPNADAWGLRILNSDINVYGAGHYSFFDNYSTNCSAPGNGAICQARIVEIEGSPALTVYNLNTVGTHYMITYDGKNVANYAANENGFFDTVALFRPS